MSRLKPPRKKSEIIENFLLNFRSSNTIKAYKSHLEKFFDFLNVNPDTYFNDSKSLADYTNDVKRFARSLMEKPPLTQSSILQGVRTFLTEYDVELKSKVWKSLKNRRRLVNKPVTLDKTPTNDELKQILQHGSIKARALFLMISSSGLRIGEATQLKWKDINLETRKIDVRAEYTKTGSYRYTYITEEALDALLSWKKEIGNYLRTKEKKSWYYRKSLKEKGTIEPDNRIFPFGPENARKM